jgi:hypothetical protein
MPSSTSAVKLEGKARLYNPSGLAAVCVSHLGSGLSPGELRAGARASIRHQKHLNDHSLTKRNGGLHPMYLDLHGLGGASAKELQENDMLVKETQQDVFDAVSTYPGARSIHVH